MSASDTKPLISFAKLGMEFHQQRVLAEDAAMLNSLQNGLGSKNFQPGRLAQLEAGVLQVLQGYLGRMFGEAR